jgi:hypothetical protein
MLRCHRRRSNGISAHLEEHAPQMILQNDQMPPSQIKWCCGASQNLHKSNKTTLILRHVINSKRRTKRSTGKSPAIPGFCFWLQKAHQTPNPKINFTPCFLT